ncbi:MAG: hypothetical protein P9L96_03175 [Candidatus Gygaella obscura]|nr:hypothetical protein [Candidatus Gygaella obscura]
MKKKKFISPKISVIKLAPEQAVLSCNCYSSGSHVTGSSVHNVGIASASRGYCWARGNAFHLIHASGGRWGSASSSSSS